MSALNDPIFLAGLAVMKGANPGDALTQAAMMQRQQQQDQMQQAQFEMQQQQMLMSQQDQQRRMAVEQNLPKILESLRGKSPQDAFLALRTMGMSTEEAGAIASRIAPQSDMFTGANNVRYQTVTDPNTGQMKAVPVPGQEMGAVETRSPQEVKMNLESLQKYNDAANIAQDELRLLADGEKSFKKFDENTIGITGAGSLVSKILPTFAQNAIYNEDAQTAAQEIEKLNSSLTQNVVKSLKGSGTMSDKDIEMISKGLPNLGITPDARASVFKTLKRKNYEPIIKSQFFNEWARQNNKDISGAEYAYNQFIGSNELLDDRGDINGNLLKSIPNVVNSALSGNPIVGTKPVEAKKKTRLRDFSIEELIAEREKRRKK